jgi:long-subunit acyl-CoA synthetase (AMP-forming)
MEIYGMSECTGPHILNKFDKQRVGTIGTPMEGLEAMTENVEGDHDTRFWLFKCYFDIRKK